MRWTVSLHGGPQRVNHATVGIAKRNLVFSFGGFWSGKEYIYIQKIDIHVFNVKLLRWYRLKSPEPTDPEYEFTPYMRYGHTVSAVGHLAYLFGGRNDKKGASDVLHCFDTDKLKWSVPETTGYAPSARDGHSSTTVGNCVYIFGGFEEIEECFSCDIHFLDTETMTWHHPVTRGEGPTWRDFHTSTTVGNSIYVFGGRGDELGPYHSNQELYDNQVYQFDTQKETWTCFKSNERSPPGRRSHATIALGTDLLVFGGFNGNLFKHYGDLWKFDTQTKDWTELSPTGNGPCARRRQSMCLLGTKAVLYGGTCPINDDDDNFPFDNETSLKDLDDVYVLDFAPSLKTLCEYVVIEHKLNVDHLPTHLRQELERMSSSPNRSLPCTTKG